MASKAEAVTAGAFHNLSLDLIGGNRVATARSRAPGDVHVVFDKGLCNEPQILLVNGFVRHQVTNDFIGDRNVALVSRAVNAKNLSRSNLHGQILSPAIVAEAMAASQCRCIVRTGFFAANKTFLNSRQFEECRGNGEGFHISNLARIKASRSENIVWVIKIMSKQLFSFPLIHEKQIRREKWSVPDNCAGDSRHWRGECEGDR